MKGLGLAWAICFGATVLGAAGTRAEDVLKLAVGQRGAFETSLGPLGEEAGIFRKHGIRIEAFYTQGTGETQQAVISGSADIGIGVGTLGVMAAFAKGAPLRVIGASMTGGRDQYWYAPPNSPIKSMRDTSGKTVAYSTAGSSTNTAVLGFRDLYKVDLKPVATGSPPNTFPQVMSGQIDVGWSGGAILYDKVEDGTVRVIARTSEIPWLQGQTPRVIITNLATLEKRRDALTRFMQATRETWNWLYASPDAIPAFARWGEFKPGLAAKVREETYLKEDLDPDRIVGIDTLKQDAVKFKYVSAPLTDAQIAELFRVPFK